MRSAAIFRAGTTAPDRSRVDRRPAADMAAGGAALMGLYADRMADRLSEQGEWPATDDQRVYEQVKAWIAFRENDRDVLRGLARWRNQIRDYKIDPLAPKINEAFASTIFGRMPTITPASTGDQANANRVVEGNNLGSQLQREEKRCSSEAEVWWRVTSNPVEDEVPMVVWRSRLNVIPHFHKGILRCVAFFEELGAVAGDGEQTRWRHFEIIDKESIVNLLFCGTHDTIGERADLAEHPETADLFETVEHELPFMPAGRIANKEATDIFYCLSDFAGIEDFLYGLNEILTIFVENVRLTLKKRVTVPASAVDEAGTIDASQEVLVAEELNQELGKNGQGASMFSVLEYKSDIEDVIKAQNAFAEAALTRIGIVPAYVGMTTEGPSGRALSGTALRLRLIPTVNAAEDRAQYWDDALPKILCLLFLLDARPVADPGAEVLGGFGRAWQNPGGLPSVDRGSSLPEDEVETTTVHATRVQAGIEARQTAVEDMHQDWSEDRVQEEMKRLDADAKAAAEVAGGAFGGVKPVGERHLPPMPRGDS